MKQQLLTLTVLLMLVASTSASDAQAKDTILTSNRVFTEIREGNLIYLKSDRMIEKAATKDLGGKSYEYFSVYPHDENLKLIFHPIIRSVFSEEREKQLAGTSFFCNMIISPVEKKILHFEFYWSKTEDDAVPFTLSELDELERKLRAEPKLIKYYSDGEKSCNDVLIEIRTSGKIVDHGERIIMLYRFGNSDNVKK